MSQSTHDSEGTPQMQLPPRLFDLWETEIVPQLPANLDEQARSLGAYQRYREIERASDLLRALLAWVLGGCSFRQLGGFAVILGVADISEAAWRLPRAAVRGVVAVAAHRSAHHPAQWPYAPTATGDPGRRNESGTNRGHGR
jgi:hypothetical protein